jgi:putative ABC transport system permease protein
MRLVSLVLLGAAVALHTAVFTAVDVVLLRPLPFPDPDRLVVVSERKLTADTDELSTLGNYQDLTRSAPAGAGSAFAALGAYASADPVLFAGDAPRAFEVLRVTTSLFQALSPS